MSTISLTSTMLKYLSLLSLYCLRAKGFVTPTPVRAKSSSQLFYEAIKNSSSDEIRFLGKAADALVRPGVVLIAPSNEFHHFYRQSAIFIHAMGMDENEEEVIRGVILDQPTPFTMEEMAGLDGRLGGNLLYRGGNIGGETAMMLQRAGGDEEIGTSGVFEGGLTDASERDDDIDNYKFFFNYCEFLPNELEGMLDQVDSETGDGWMSVEVPSAFITEDWDKGDCWRHLRNVLRQRSMDDDATDSDDFDPYDP